MSRQHPLESIVLELVHRSRSSVSTRNLPIACWCCRW